MKPSEMRKTNLRPGKLADDCIRLSKTESVSAVAALDWLLI